MSTTTTDFVQIARVGDLKPGEMKMYLLQGREVLLALVGEQYYAVDNRCRHMGGNLSKGQLNGTVVTCPRHGSQFDIKDGHVVRWTTWPAALLALDQFRSQRRPLPVFAVKVEDDKIMLRLS